MIAMPLSRRNLQHAAQASMGECCTLAGLPSDRDRQAPACIVFYPVSSQASDLSLVCFNFDVVVIRHKAQRLTSASRIQQTLILL
jgi:hypothetical protein